MSISYACPGCGGATSVKDSRPRESGGIRRRRRCNGCGARFTTYEFGAENVDDVLTGVQGAPLEAVRQAKELVNIVGRMSADDRIMLLGMARRLDGGTGVSRHFQQTVTRLGEVAA